MTQTTLLGHPCALVCTRVQPSLTGAKMTRTFELLVKLFGGFGAQSHVDQCRWYTWLCNGACLAAWPGVLVVHCACITPNLAAAAGRCQVVLALAL